MSTKDKLMQNDGLHVYAEEDRIENCLPSIFGEEYLSAKRAETELSEFAERVIKEGTARWKKFGQYDNHNEGGDYAPDYDGKIRFKVFYGDTLVIYGEGVMPDFTFQIDINGWELNSSIKERKITRLAICGNITEIGPRNFLGFQNLRTVVLPSALKVIGREAFCRCDSLGHVTLPEGLERIGAKAFYNAALTQVCIPSGVKTIEAQAFYCGLIVNRKSIPTLKTVLIPRGRNFDFDEVFRLTDLDDLDEIRKGEENASARISLDWHCNYEGEFIAIYAADHQRTYSVGLEANPADEDESPKEVILEALFSIYREFFPDEHVDQQTFIDSDDPLLLANFNQKAVEDLIADFTDLVESAEPET